MSTISKIASTLLKFKMIKGIGTGYLKKIAEIDYIEELLYDEIIEELKKKPNSDKKLINILETNNNKDLQRINNEVSKQIELLEKYQVNLFCSKDSLYPKLLKTSLDDPTLIFVKGKLAEEHMKSVAVIGTREPTKHGKIICERITKWLVEHNTSIVSGLALGCDTIAHQTTVLSKGHTIAVLASGLDKIYPKENEQLAESILENNGAILSTYPIGTDIQKYEFVNRDKIQAALSEGVVMIQSNQKGGSLHASKASLINGRWLAVPYPTTKDLEDRNKQIQTQNLNESKIEANLILATKNIDQISQLFSLKKIEYNVLDNIKILRSREDYENIFSFIKNDTEMEQGSLIF